ncbi:hypothetical protein XELAEV_18003644mg [Xenopus laevis]|nr:hypothetical protein XELAEV_18003644mg [Xenopus laevis]
MSSTLYNCKTLYSFFRSYIYLQTQMPGGYFCINNLKSSCNQSVIAAEMKASSGVFFYNWKARILEGKHALLVLHVSIYLM